MPTTKKATSNRFSRFKDPEFKKGIAPLATLQALIDDRGDEDMAGYFIKADNLAAAKWTATEDDFDEGAVHWNHTFKFSTGAREKGHFFTKPRMQIIMTTPTLVHEQATKTVVGCLTDESMMKDDQGNWVPTKSEFELDRQMVEEGKRSQRRYGTRQLYCCFLLTKDGKWAHQVPLMLTLSGINNVKLSKALTEHQKNLDRAMSIINDEDSEMRYDARTRATYVFCPTLKPELQDNKFKTTNVAIDDVVEVDLTDLASVEAGLEALVVSEEQMDKTFDLMTNEMLTGYVNRFLKQEEDKMLALGKPGYGKAEHVIIPVDTESVKQLASAAVDTGEDKSL